MIAQKMHIVKTADIIEHRKAVSTYFSAWQRKDYSMMLKNAQKSWKLPKSDKLEAINWMRKTCSVIKIIKFDLQESSAASEAMSTTTVLVRAKIGKRMGQLRLLVNVVEEQGHCGVNPISVLRGLSKNI